ncbi:probable LRR receptor-like serine/threonine-protein kinase At4g31250 [Euphorbia lathyris]|uniref:probable LRR receptor-like serine/threonine-protein kinase At4g31250 n=1 Tax=Euphorbia lathyris TaxID=212925 RepID=UPI0033137A3C
MAYYIIPYSFLIITLLFQSSPAPVLSSDADAAVLLTFKSFLSNSDGLRNWEAAGNNVPVNPCTANWTGVHCTDDDAVDKLTLENIGLSGKIDTDSLAKLTKLKALSFMNNSFEGEFPSGINKLISLRSLYLAYNKFSGAIPDNAFFGMGALSQIYLGYNNFNGSIPSSLLPLSKLSKLGFEYNKFDGKIPDFSQDIVYFNVINNHLTGRIPPSLANINASFFAGNDGLCGKPLASCKTSKKKIIIIAAVVAACIVALAAILIFAYLRTRKNNKSTLSQRLQVTSTKPETRFAVTAQKETVEPEPEKRGEIGKLSFVRDDCSERFELQDLLRASAEILGNGSIGASYKAIIGDGSAMVVKRFREMNKLGKDEFDEHMKRLGSLLHRNLIPLVAFYFRKDEKLLVSEFVDNGSLATYLHGKRGAGLNWPNRLKIIKGVAKGLEHLHKTLPDLPVPHGHLQSSNVILDQNFDPLLSDYALLPVLNTDHAQQFMVAYKSPEFAQTDRISRKTDVWSLGILILEILTGKFPANYLRKGKGGGNSDLAAWVNSVVREEWTGEVFDMNMRGTKNGEGEMLKLLKIGMCCCEWKLEKRWDLRKAVEKIEELKERDSESDDLNSSGDIYSSRAMTDDDFSFSINA